MFIITSLCLYLLLVVQPLWAKVSQVELYPRGAKITGVIQVKDFPYTFTLPGTANPETLTFKTNSQTAIYNFSYKSSPTPPPLIAFWEQKLAGLLQKQKELETQIQVKEIKLNFWIKQSEKNSFKVDLLKKVAQELEENVLILNKEKLLLQEKLDKLKEEINSIQDKIKELAAQDNSWEVKLEGQGQGTIYYTYFTPHAGWNNFYSLHNFTPKDISSLIWQGKLWQKTGEDWQEAKISLISGFFSRKLEPPSLTPWILSPFPVFQPMEMNFRKSAPLKSLDQASPKPGVPQKKEGIFFDSYELPQLTLKAGEEKTVTLQKFTPRVKLSYILRPYFSSQVYVQADLKFSNNLRLPPGKINLFLDNVLVGSKNFSLATNSTSLFLGNDPQIKTSVHFKKEHEKKGVFSKEHTYLYQYEITLKNNKKKKVKITIEDSKPISEEKKVSITPLFEVKPQEEKDVFKWEINLNPQEKKTFHYGYKISYPADLNLDLGR
ncbi:MAG TPA: hypothetical protein DIT19_04120 [Desulfonauticus sp.]|jgi:uncharacterized protein (TIGR02231 family)|nr:MAG: hypothetical protein XD41_1516 [Desulfonauticus sp. 38_4375]MDK2921552.1 hypothetical protein [Desulfonauticus sp.]HCO12394.1 hypothetical protein [Desulfonauticus sp.]